MSNQILREKIPAALLYDLCENISIFKTDNYFVLNKSSFKKAEFNKLLEGFRESIKPYYHKSKIYYVERPLNYSKFITLLRQICKCNHISYTSKIKYDKSSYDIYYYIYK
jgi:hypothetical protein